MSTQIATSDLFCAGCGHRETIDEPVFWDKLAGQQRCGDCLTTEVAYKGHVLRMDDGTRFRCIGCGMEHGQKTPFAITPCDSEEVSR